MRNFSTAHEEKCMKLDNREFQQCLMDRQRLFDSAPTNMRYATIYFRELNRHQKFSTVVRLYEKYETEYRANKDFKMQDKVRDQYSYA